MCEIKCPVNSKIKRKREKPEDFIGWESKDGNLKVIGIHGKSNNNTTFKVTCNICSPDTELYPDGYFVSTKDHLKSGRKPCGCSKQPKWIAFQYLILAQRVGRERFIVHGFAEEFHGQKTKLDCECLIDGDTWYPTIGNIISNHSGCPSCAKISRRELKKLPEHQALNNCENICEEFGYTPLGFPSGYENNNSWFEYICPNNNHGRQKIRYSSFVNNGSRCPECWKYKQKEIGTLYGYYPERKDEQDFLYVLNFDDQYIKVGRSFDVDGRIDGLSIPSVSGIKNIIKLRIFTATHQEIWDLEQELLEELRERGFQYKLSWTKECFENDSLFILNKLLDNCSLVEM